MSKGVAGAIALILLWLAFVSFFVAFHPGGIRDSAFTSDSNPDGLAQNPRDVILYFIKQFNEPHHPTPPEQTALWLITRFREHRTESRPVRILARCQKPHIAIGQGREFLAQLRRLPELSHQKRDRQLSGHKLRRGAKALSLALLRCRAATSAALAPW